jgi:thermitase
LKPMFKHCRSLLKAIPLVALLTMVVMVSTIVADTPRAVEPIVFSSTTTLDSGRSVEFEPGEALIRFRPGAPPGITNNVLGALRGERKRYLRQINVWLVNTQHGNEIGLVQGLQHNPWVEFAELNYRTESTYTPNDPDYNSPNLVYAPQKIEAPLAWDHTLGSSSVVIAIVDSGVNAAHEDLAGRVLAGKDYVNGDNDAADDNGHGTHVAGIAAATTDNGTGIAGIAQASILPVKVLNQNNVGTWANVASGIIWATDKGADIINLSLGGSANSETLRSAIQYASDHGVILVAAAGNKASDVPFYPAAYSETLGVAATTYSDNRWSLSNFGTYIDLAAPGVAIWSTNWTAANPNDYTSRSGTSMAAPHVSGVAALMLSVNPGLSQQEVYDILRQSADDLGDPGWDVIYGYGRLNAGNAVVAALSPSSTPTPSNTPTVTNTLTDTPTPTVTNTPTDTPTPTPTLEPPQNTLVVDELDSGVLMGKSGKYKLKSTFDAGKVVHLRAHVVDGQTGSAVTDAFVEFTVTLPDGSHVAAGARSDQKGDAITEFTSTSVAGNYVEAVFTVSQTGYVYDEAASVGPYTFTVVGDSPTPTPTPEPTPTPTPTTPPGSPINMHVGDLDGVSTNLGKDWQATITITVHDTDHNPVSSATVSGSWRSGYSGTGSCTTDGSGQCGVTSGNIQEKLKSVTFAVSGVTHATLDYQRSDNHDPDGDSNGNWIKVLKP